MKKIEGDKIPFAYHYLDPQKEDKKTVEEWEALVLEALKIKRDLKKVEYLIKKLILLPPGGN